MREHEASRTLVKSAPELWAECSDAGSLGRHLDKFGEIRITRLEPETTVAWEGEDVSGTVRLEPSGWGTRVILTAYRGEEPEPTPPPAPEPETPPDPVPLPPAAETDELPARSGRLSRFFSRWFSPPSEADPAAGELILEEPQTSETPAGEPAPTPLEPDSSHSEAMTALTSALESLGQAHHRPFSRA